jgi:hypothetical protein
LNTLWSRVAAVVQVILVVAVGPEVLELVLDFR